MRLVQDMQQVLAQSCGSPSGVHIESTHTSDGTQLAIIWHDRYIAMHGPCAAQSQHSAQSTGAVQSGPPLLDESAAPVESDVALVCPPPELLVPEAWVVMAALLPSSAMPSVAGMVVGEPMVKGDVVPVESSPAQPKARVRVRATKVSQRIGRSCAFIPRC